MLSTCNLRIVEYIFLQFGNTHQLVIILFNSENIFTCNSSMAWIQFISYITSYQYLPATIKYDVCGLDAIVFPIPGILRIYAITIVCVANLTEGINIFSRLDD